MVDLVRVLNDMLGDAVKTQSSSMRCDLFVFIHTLYIQHINSYIKINISNGSRVKIDFNGVTRQGG